jgi:hypothetical protein
MANGIGPDLSEYVVQIADIRHFRFPERAIPMSGSLPIHVKGLVTICLKLLNDGHANTPAPTRYQHSHPGIVAPITSPFHDPDHVGTKLR